MRPTQASYKKHQETLNEVINKKLEYEKKQVEWIAQCAAKRMEKMEKDESTVKKFEIIKLKPEKPFELKILKK